MSQNEYQTKIENINMTNECRHCLESNVVVNWLFGLIYLNRNNDVKRHKCKKYCLPKGIIKSYNGIVNEKLFFDQPIDSGIKWY